MKSKGANLHIRQSSLEQTLQSIDQIQDCKCWRGKKERKKERALYVEITYLCPKSSAHFAADSLNLAVEESDDVQVFARNMIQVCHSTD